MGRGYWRYLTERVDPRSFDIELQREYTGEGSERIESIIEFDAKTRLPMRGGQDIHDLPRSSNPNIKSYEKIAPKTLRVHLTRDRKMTLGAYVVIRHQVYVYNAFTIHHCARVVLRDVTIHHAPGMGLSAKRTEDVTLLRVRMVPRPRSGRVLSISSDGTHFSGCSGTIRIVDCTFQGMGDDATNIHGFYLNVVAEPKGRTVEAKCKKTWIWPPIVGDVMEFTDPISLLPYATGVVTAVEVDRPSRIHRVTFRDPLPERLKVGDFLANASHVPAAYVAGNTVLGNRARGFVIKTRNAVIENNRLEGVSGAGIFVAVEGDHWRESIATRNVIVRNNLIRNCNGGPSRRWAAICVFALSEGHRQGAVGVHRGLLIQGNRIEGTDNAGIFLAAADGVRIEGNRIVNCSRKPTRLGGNSAIYLMNCRNVVIKGNSLKRPGPGLRKPLVFGANVDADTITVEGNSGFGPQGKTGTSDQ